MLDFKNLLALADDKLADVFHKKAHDPSKAREKIIEQIDKTKEQFSATETPRGRKWWKLNRGVVELNLPFSISGKSTFYIPSERFEDFLNSLTKSVAKGDLDDAIANGVEEDAGTVATPARKASAGTRPGWSEERRQRQQATYEARAAKKAKEAAKA